MCHCMTICLGKYLWQTKRITIVFGSVTIEPVPICGVILFSEIRILNDHVLDFYDKTRNISLMIVKSRKRDGIHYLQIT